MTGTQSRAVGASDRLAAPAVAIRCRGLHKKFGDTVAVESLDLEVRRGECFGLLGPNGAGKTTTIEILNGLQPATSGEVEVLGMYWDRDGDRIRQRLGIQLQESELPEKQTVEETLRLFRSFYPRGREVEELVALVGLEEKRRTWARNLSGGQRQRLSVACALAGDPEILFLDEPTTGLDPQSRRQLWEVVDAFKRAGGTVVLTTHFMDEAEHLSDRVAIMDHGRTLVEDTPAALIASLGGETIEFASTVPLSDAELRTLPTVSHATGRDGFCQLVAEAPHRVMPALLELIEGRGGRLTSLATHRATLDDVFLTRTGRQLRE